MIKAAVITIDMQKEKAIGIDFFHGDDCWRKASAFKERMEGDWPKPRYHTICTATQEARKIGMEAIGITGMFDEVAA